ncbi:hypothetical protein [Aliikangiella sp. G2MR2-5]|uniref:hypothetical protein n=1 Tax=Aliikangiella sp. G2MR2-5 TaxID=2788943 RepID=UPI0018AB63F9|nr:hypothetical protein [Aliikangiella sp. G2MR2-5]
MKIISIFLLMAFSFHADATSLVSMKDVDEIGFSSKEIHKSINIGPDVILEYSFGITSKGNGGLVAINKFIRIYDTHSDGITFKNGLLNSELIDVDGDGYLDIKLWGVAVLTDEKEKSLGEKDVSALLIYSKKLKGFDIKEKSDEIDIWQKLKEKNGVRVN